MTPSGDPGMVYCGNYAGMFKTTDYGDHWQMINNGIPRTSMMSVLGADPNRRPLVRVQTSEDDIYFSTDDGYDWDPLPRNSDYGSVSGFAFDPVDSLRQWMLRGRG